MSAPKMPACVGTPCSRKNEAKRSTSGAATSGRAASMNEGLAFHILHRQIHLAFRIAKNAECGDLLRQPARLLLFIRVTDAQQNNKTMSDGGDGLAVNSDAGLGDSLD
jgi:hypothetical protein